MTTTTIINTTTTINTQPNLAQPHPTPPLPPPKHKK